MYNLDNFPADRLLKKPCTHLYNYKKLSFR